MQESGIRCMSRGERTCSRTSSGCSLGSGAVAHACAQHGTRAQQRVREKPVRYHHRRWEPVGRQHSPCLSDESRQQAPPWRAGSAHIWGNSTAAAASASQITAQQCSPLPVCADCAGTCGGSALLRCVRPRQCGGVAEQQRQGSAQSSGGWPTTMQNTHRAQNNSSEEHFDDKLNGAVAVCI